MDKERPVLYSYFESSAAVLAAEYERSKGQRSSANLGKNREQFCSEFLEKVVPSRLGVRTGEAWNAQGVRTGQLDVALYRDDSPVLAIGGADVLLAEGLFAALEVKSNLTKVKLDESIKTMREVEALGDTFRPALVSGPVLRRPMRLLFAYEGCTFKTLVNHLAAKGALGLFDVISSLNRGAVVAKSDLLSWGDDSPMKSIPSPAASLGFLFLYITSYAGSFVGRSVGLTEYFTPIAGWLE